MDTMGLMQQLGVIPASHRRLSGAQFAGSHSTHPTGKELSPIHRIA